MVNAPRGKPQASHRPTIPAHALDWQNDGLCTQVGLDLFFPDAGESAAKAISICDRCAVELQCLQYALDHDERFGVWGGVSERDRRRMRGTRGIYDNR
jgi:WhiB family redox-sensing transcriptional regulator